MTDHDLDAVQQADTATPRTGQRRLAALFASLLIAPGAGQLARGRLRRGIAWFVVWNLSTLTLPLLQLAGVAGVLLLYLACAADAAAMRAAKRTLPRWGTVISIWAAAFVLTVGVRVGYRELCYEPFRTPSGSMQPTLEVGDQFFVRKYARSPSLGELIVYQSSQEPHKDFVKRVVAVGGDTVELRDNELYLNGGRVSRGRLGESCMRDELDTEGDRPPQPCIAYEEQLGGKRYRIIHDATPLPPNDQPPTRIPAGHVFVLGDNRDNSFDSRGGGPRATRPNTRNGGLHLVFLRPRGGQVESSRQVAALSGRSGRQ